MTERLIALISTIAPEIGRAESPEQAQRWLRAIHREGRRLSVLTENVLLHARGERGGIRAALRVLELRDRDRGEDADDHDDDQKLDEGEAGPSTRHRRVLNKQGEGGRGTARTARALGGNSEGAPRTPGQGKGGAQCRTSP